MLPGAGAAAAPTTPTTKPGSAKEAVGNYDSRSAGPARKVLEARSALAAANPSAGVKNLRQELGVQGIVDIDALTGTPRRVTRVDGFLTNASKAAPATIAIDYVRAHTDALGLTASAVDALTLRNSYTDVEGTTHLSFVQQVGGVSFFGNGLKAHVTKDGRLIQLDGSPAGALPARIAEPALVATAARDKAVADTFGASKATVTKSATSGNKLTTFSGGDQAQLVLFQTLTGPRLGWQTITMKEGFLHVIDAQSGRTLFRQSLVANDSGLAWENYPGAAKGGQQNNVNLSAKDWLPNNSPRLAGNVAHVFLDLNDNDLADAGEEVAPSGSKKFNYPFTPFTGASCLPQYVCSWDPNVPFSWQTNAKQNAVQMMFFLGTWHDHLEKAPIGFTRSAGNFEAVDGDAVSANALDGANTAGGLPDGDHIDNANMLTPRTASHRGCRCTCSTSPGRRSRTRTSSSPATRVTRRTSCTTSTPTVCPTGSSWMPTASRRSVLSRPGPWVRPGVTGTAGTSSSMRAWRRTPALRARSWSVSTSSTAGRSVARHWTARSDRLRRSALVARAPALADLPTATSVGSPPDQRFTRTARSGPRRCGTCARLWAARPPSPW